MYLIFKLSKHNFKVGAGTGPRGCLQLQQNYPGSGSETLHLINILLILDWFSEDRIFGTGWKFERNMAKDVYRNNLRVELVHYESLEDGPGLDW